MKILLVFVGLFLSVILVRLTFAASCTMRNCSTTEDCSAARREMQHCYDQAAEAARAERNRKHQENLLKHAAEADAVKKMDSINRNLNQSLGGSQVTGNSAR